MEKWKFNIVLVLIFAALLTLGAELVHVYEGYADEGHADEGQVHEVLCFPGYGMVLAITGCAYFITAIKVLRIIQRGVP